MPSSPAISRRSSRSCAGIPAALLLAHGVDPGAADKDGMTGLHWAAANRHLEIVKLLAARGAPLEVRNKWGGTVLDSTIYFALNPPPTGAIRTSSTG